jgi:hypothetical protein
MASVDIDNVNYAASTNSELQERKDEESHLQNEAFPTSSNLPIKPIAFASEAKLQACLPVTGLKHLH